MKKLWLKIKTQWQGQKDNPHKTTLILFVLAVLLVVPFQNCAAPGGSSTASSQGTGPITPPPAPAPGPTPTPTCTINNNLAPVVDTLMQGGVDRIGQTINVNVGMGTDAGSSANITMQANGRLSANNTEGAPQTMNALQCSKNTGNALNVAVTCNNGAFTQAGNVFSKNFTIATNQTECFGGTILVDVRMQDTLPTVCSARPYFQMLSAPVQFTINATDTCKPTQKINSSTPYAQGKFGSAVDIDGNLAVAVSSGDEERAVDAGAAFAFVNNGGTWSIDAKLIPSDLAASDELSSVAISGNLIIVGSMFHNNGQGAAWIFQRNGPGSWSEIKKLVSPSPVALGFFGNAVDIAGATAVVGSYGANQEAGNAFVFGGSNYSTSQEIKPAVQAGDQYGWSVAISGSTIAVGAPVAQDAPVAGDERVYVYKLSGSWSLDEFIANPAGTNVSSRFGHSVALQGSNLVVGAPNRNRTVGANSFVRAGEAYLFADSGTWARTQTYAIGQGTLADDALGQSVAVSGSDVIIGSPQNVNDQVGRAFHYNTAGTFLFRLQARGADRTNGDRFSEAVAISGDWVIVGAQLDDASLVNDGRVYFMRLR